jgi:transposase
MSPSFYLYPSDLSDREWEIFAPLIPPAKPGGRPKASGRGVSSSTLSSTF